MSSSISNRNSSNLAPSNRSSNRRSSQLLSDETLETIRKFEAEKRRINRSNRSSRFSGRIIDDVNKALLESNPESPVLCRRPSKDLSSKSSILEEDLETCGVCYVDYERDAMVALSGCLHYFCETCVKRHLTTHIEEGRAIKISCM